MLSSVRSWKNSFFKVCTVRGFDPFFMRDGRFRYPVKWSVPVKQSRSRSFEELSEEDQNAIVRILATGPFDAQYLIRSWLKRASIKIESWKMDAERFEAARSRVLAKQKPLAPPAVIESLSEELPMAEQSPEVTSGRSSGSRSKKSSGRTKTLVSRKRKERSSETPSDKGGSSSTDTAASQKVKAVDWPEVEMINRSDRGDLPFDQVDSLWYRGMDYGAYLRQHLRLPVDQERNADYIREHGAIRLVKSSAAQIVRSAASILSAIPALHKTALEHAAVNPAEVSRLKEELETKKEELVGMGAEVGRLEDRVAELERLLQGTNELLSRREQELATERKERERAEAGAAEREAQLRGEVESAEDAAYELYQRGFDQAVVQIKYFNPSAPLDTSKLNRDKDLADLVKELDAVL